MVENVHAFILGQVISFIVIAILEVIMHPRVAFNPNELVNITVCAASVEIQKSWGRHSSQRKQWSLFIKVAVSWPELMLHCLLMPRDSNNWSNNHDINSYENMSSVGPYVVKMTSRVCETLKVGFRSNNIEAYFHMSCCLMCSDGWFKQHFLFSCFCQMSNHNRCSIICVCALNIPYIMCTAGLIQK